MIIQVDLTLFQPYKLVRNRLTTADLKQTSRCMCYTMAITQERLTDPTMSLVHISNHQSYTKILNHIPPALLLLLISNKLDTPSPRYETEKSTQKFADFMAWLTRIHPRESPQTVIKEPLLSMWPVST